MHQLYCQLKLVAYFLDINSKDSMLSDSMQANVSNKSKKTDDKTSSKSKKSKSKTNASEANKAKE